ncbi:MAG TPA: NAD(P)/FAD-dependent oxidoreductase, partial [Nevskia sp.]|nr:NAD(P)/FAD-dependent oxidoreductase [Nevskia sp.]
MQYDVIVIGGGAAGLMCAAVAGRRGRSVLLIEHANRVGKKILMSGGGRCNFTNLHAAPENFLSANPHFCKSALARYTQWDFIAMVDRHGIAWHEKELGQLFCDISSKQIVQMLLDECAAAGVCIETACAIEQVRREGERYALATTRGMRGAASLVVASGGLSIPKMGATGYGYELARQFGHRVLATRAALVPLTLSGRPLEDYAELSGVALPAVVAECEGQSFRAGFLVTHRGLSGPAILQISSYWEPGKPLHLNLLPDLDSADALAAQQRERPAAELKTVLGEWLPKRLAQRLCELRFGNRPMRQYHPGELRDIAAALHRWPVIASGTEGYRTAEVTLGGVDTQDGRHRLRLRAGAPVRPPR